MAQSSHARPGGFGFFWVCLTAKDGTFFGASLSKHSERGCPRKQIKPMLSSFEIFHLALV